MGLLATILGFLRKPAPTDDRELVDRALRGDARARRALAERIGPFIRARVRTSTRGRSVHGHDPDDLVQEVWIRLLANDGKLLRGWDPKRASLPGYVNLIAGQALGKTVAHETAQKRRPEGGFAPEEDAPEPAQPRSDPEQQAAEREELSTLWIHLDGALPDAGRLVLRMLYVECASATETAAATGMKVATVYSWQHKIKKAAKSFAEGRR